MEIIKITKAQITSIYKKFSTLRHEGLLIEWVGDNGEAAFRSIASSEGSIPVYFSFENDTVFMDWDFKRISLSKKALTLDFEYLVKSTFEATYTHRTAFQGISMLTAGSSFTLSGSNCEYKYPNIVPNQESRRYHIEPIEAALEFEYLLKKRLRHQLGNTNAIGMELSGGMDSSIVAISAYSEYIDTPINSYGIIISDPTARKQQRKRRSSVARSINSIDYSVDIRCHIPSLISPSAEKYYLNAEAYADAFDKIWYQAKEAGHSTLLNGCGGDELFPQYSNEDFSADRMRTVSSNNLLDYNSLLSEKLSKKAQEVLGSKFLSCAPASDVDPCALIAMARRAPLLLNFNIIPLYPLRDATLIEFSSMLPKELRLNKTILEQLLNRSMNNRSFSNYPKETFMHTDEISLLRNRDLYLRKCKDFRIIEVGLIDFKTLKSDLTAISAHTPRHVFDYILNLLSIERFLSAYL